LTKEIQERTTQFKEEKKIVMNTLKTKNEEIEKLKEQLVKEQQLCSTL